MIALPADEHEVSVEAPALGRHDQKANCHSLAETDDPARSTRLVQVLNNLQPDSQTDRHAVRTLFIHRRRMNALAHVRQREIDRI